MKCIALLLSLFLSLPSFCQTYDSSINRAATLMKQNDDAGALAQFKMAFADTLQAGTYDLYYGARVAVRCRNLPLAFEWLNIAQRKGLGLGQGEIGYLQKDSVLFPLHADPGWGAFLANLQQAYAGKEAADKKKSDEWLAHPPPGFTHYFSRADTLRVPYLVYVPPSCSGQTHLKAIVYLHGGVNSFDDFDYKNPATANEPIFAAADSLHVAVIYPFARKSFGWSDQKAAFEQVLHIVSAATHAYPIDDKQLFMVGMSNGGSACFWFASQPSSPFKGFLALSANPKLNIGEIDFTRIGPDRPLYSVNTKDDDQFAFNAVSQIYAAKKNTATGWNFLTLESGGHGFIYGDNGNDLLIRYLRMLIR